MADFNERPDDKFIDEHREHLESVWRNTRESWEEIDDFYQLRFPVWKGPNAGNHAKNRGSYRPSTARNIIDQASDQFLGFIPKPRREPLQDTQTDKDDAEAVESAVKAIMMDSAMKTMSQPWKSINKSIDARGYGATKIDLHPSAPGKDRPAYWNPVRIYSVNPGSILLDPLEKEPPAGFETIQMTVHQIMQRAARKKNLKFFYGLGEIEGMSPWQRITIDRYWTRSWHTFKVKGGPIIYQEKNAWGFVPLAHTFAGFGMEPINEGAGDPQYLAQGILEAVKESIRIQAQSKTAKHTMVIEEAYMPFGTSRDPAEMMKAIESGNILTGDAADYWKMRLSEIPRWVFEEDRDTDTDIQRGTYNPAIVGFREQGVTTVGQQAILDNSGRRKFAGPAMQVEHLASIQASWILRLVDKLPQLKAGIGAHGKLLRRSQIHGVYDMSVTFDVLDPALQMQREELGLRKFSVGLQSDVGFWRDDAAVENISGLKQELDEQAIRNNPDIRARRIAEVAQSMDEVAGEDVELLAKAAQAGELPVTSTEDVSRPLRQPLTEEAVRPARLDNAQEL